MQRVHNVQVHPEWDKQGFAFYRAIWTECAELLEHYGWKWWRSTERDIAQVKLEIVDIWHFGLSMIIIEEREIEMIATQMDAMMERVENPDPEHFIFAVENLAAHALKQTFNIRAFMEVMRHLPFSLFELYGIYKGKNVLNRFRQQNGYQSGTYQKLWSGREDNLHLAEVVSSIDVLSDEFEIDLSHALAQRYQSLTGKLC